jgi:PIN domain nuclease of toxin-antitoxin system
MENNQAMILLDTHVLVWMAIEPGKLSRAANDAIQAANQSGGLSISAISLWETAWLAVRGRIEFTGTPESFVEEISSRTATRPITTKIAILANQLPASYPSDPCDRLIGATAISEGIALITKDRTIRNCRQIKTIW